MTTRQICRSGAPTICTRSFAGQHDPDRAICRGVRWALLAIVESGLLFMALQVLRWTRRPKTASQAAFFEQHAARIRDHRTMFFLVPVVAFSLGVAQGIWEAATAESFEVAIFSVVFPVLALIALLVTLRLGRLPPTGYGAEALPQWALTDLKAEQRGEWLFSHPWSGAAAYCAAFAIPMAILLSLTSGEALVGIASGVAGWAFGVVVMGVALARRGARTQ